MFLCVGRGIRIDHEVADCPCESTVCTPLGVHLVATNRGGCAKQAQNNKKEKERNQVPDGCSGSTSLTFASRHERLQRRSRSVRVSADSATPEGPEAKNQEMGQRSQMRRCTVQEHRKCLARFWACGLPLRMHAAAVHGAMDHSPNRLSKVRFKN